MNPQQFIQKWCQPGAENNMRIDLESLKKDILEEHESFRFLEVPNDSSDNEED